jgi:alpha-beta hydrolase superfamily lysophospholipase
VTLGGSDGEELSSDWKKGPTEDCRERQTLSLHHLPQTKSQARQSTRAVVLSRLSQKKRLGEIMRILFLHGWNSVVGGVKPTYLKEYGHEVINPALPHEDFAVSLAIAQTEFDKHMPQVVVGASRGGAVAMNISSGDAKLVLLCPAWKKYGTARTVKPDTVILHSRADDVVPFSDSEELVRNSGLPAYTLIEVGTDHRLADPEPLELMLEACRINDEDDDILERDWIGLCYTAALRWAKQAEEDWLVVHGTVWSDTLGKRIDHAWCERGHFVVDLALPIGSRIVAKETYYSSGKPEVRKSYSADEADDLSIKNKHDGPWHDHEQLKQESILDHPAISGCYLFPQSRSVEVPFLVQVEGAELACYRKIADPSNFTLVHFHGNGEAVADYVPWLADQFSILGLNSLFVEYRQYGGSTGKAQLVAMLGDGESAIAAAGLASEKVIVFGRSIGSLYAIELAHRQRTVAGLILESGIADPSERFVMYADLSGTGVSEADLITEAKQKFNHKEKLSGYTNPLLVLHAEQDGLVDISHAERNYKWAASSQKRLVRFPFGDHNSIMGQNQDEYLKAFRSFVKTVTNM